MKPSFVVACPFRSVCDHHARVFAEAGLLRAYFLCGRRGTPGIPDELTRLYPTFGLWMYATGRLFTPRLAEFFRTGIHPLYDRWVRSQLQPGDHVLSSYGYANLSFEYARSHGGKTFLDAGNSHPDQFWEVVGREHRRWGCRSVPLPRHWYQRGKEMIPLTDFVFSPSSHVTKSFLSRGFRADHILDLPYPVDLSVFKPRFEDKREDENWKIEDGSQRSIFGSQNFDIQFLSPAPLRVICTASVSLRKGFPYLLDAMRIICQKRKAVLLLTDVVEENMSSILRHFGDVPIEWSPVLPPAALAGRLLSADVFALLSVEEGQARTALEALACGLPCVVTEATGVADLVRKTGRGAVVPECDPVATATAIENCVQQPTATGEAAFNYLASSLSAEAFQSRLLGHLRKLELA